MRTNRIFIVVGIILVALALVSSGRSVYRMITCDRVEAELRVVEHNGAERSWHAHVNYEYDGKKYTDIALTSFNAFTMKNGKKYRILIDPAHPDRPMTTSFGMDGILLLFGAVFFYAGYRGRKNGDE